MAMKKCYVGIKGVVIRDGKALVVRGDDPDRRFWDVPGGRIDDDEDVLQTLDRELHEELPNMTEYQVGKLLHVERVHKDIAENTSLVLVFYEVNNAKFDGDVRVSQEHSESAWMTSEEVEANASPTVRKAVLAALTD